MAYGPLVIDPSGQFAYVPTASGLSGYLIDASTGALNADQR